MAFTERRRFQRVRILDQVRGLIGETRIFVVDASLSGLRVVHQDDLPRPGSKCTTSFTWHGRKITLECEVQRTVVRRAAKSTHERPLYESGLIIIGARGESSSSLREMIERHVMMALDERKANARGIPPAAAQSFQTGRGDELVRHEYVKGAWRASPTTDPRQPSNGFTISAAEPVPNIEMLRMTFADADASGRKMIQQMAEMSISRAEGIPTRRYEP
jgi:hypothetical protein